MINNPISLYQKYFIDHDFERIDLFQQLADQYEIQRAFYPGSFVHVAPSFVFPVTTYIDTDRRAKRFFAYPGLMEYINDRKIYPQNPCITFHALDYRTAIPEEDQSYDLLISQYAGFISQHCKRFLKIGGVLLVNNSHGDASMASIDADYQFLAVVIRSKGKYHIYHKGLENYFIPKKPLTLNRQFLEQTQKGIAYTKAASSYLFHRLK